MGFGFLIPVAKTVIRAVIGEVFEAEKVFGPGEGEKKLASATAGATQQLSGFDKITDAIDELVTFINDVVDVLNSIGLLDDEPGLDVDYQKLVQSVKNAFSSLAALIDALS